MSEFNLADIESKKGKIAIVTGANTGLGYETVIGLAKKEMKVIMACRSNEKAQKAKNDILTKLPNADLEIILLDLNSLSSIREFVKSYKKKYSHLDILINNAGIMMPPYEKTQDQFESQIGINYLGHFLLTSLLIDIMPDTSDSRIVSLSSNAHKMGTGKINFNDLNSEKGYSKIKAYAQSKLACLVFGNELDRRLENSGKKILSVIAHPGGSETDLGRNLSKFQIFLIRYTIAPFITHCVEQATLPTLMAAIGKNIKGGEYFGPQGFLEMKGKPGRASKSKYSMDKEVAKKLWEISEKLTSSHFNL